MTAGLPPIPGFEVVSRGTAVCWVRPEVRTWIEPVLSTAPTIHAAAARLGGTPMSGRGPVYAVPTSAGVLVVRHFMRGGSVARLLGDRYLSLEAPRPFREATASERIRALGIETPRVVAAAVYRAGLFYRGDLVTELVPQAQALSDVLFDQDRGGLAGTADRKDALRETGALVSRMARAGVRHPDLNAGNVLVQWSGGTPTTYVIDLDRATVDSRPVSPEGMVQRLLRSLRKLERKTGLRLPEPEQDILVAAARRDIA